VTDGSSESGPAREPRIATNIVANLVSRVWIAVLGLAFVPVYLDALGIAAYGLVGVFTMLATVLAVLDLGLAATLDREIARLSVDTSPAGAQTLRDLVRSFAIVFWGLGAISGVIVIVTAPVIATDWLRNDTLPLDTVVSGLRIMGLMLAIQWPMGMYTNSLVGLQKQVASSTLNAVFVTVRNGGAAVVVTWLSPTVQAFFAWQLASLVLQTMVTWLVLTRALPRAPARARFRRDLLSANWKFSVGMSGVMVVSIALSQMDRLLVSRILTLEVFGYYALANSVARSLVYLVSPVFTAIYPRLCQLVAKHDEPAVRDLYHVAGQTMAVAVFPAAAVLVFFPRELMTAWTGDPEVAAATGTVVALIAVGSLLNGMLNVPFALTLAEGWTSYAVWANVVALIVLVPATLFGTMHYGPAGAAASWAVLNLGNMLIGMRVLHARLLKGEQGRWMLEAVLKPAIVTCLVAAPLRALWPHALGRLPTFAVLTVLGCVTTAALALTLPLVRGRVLKVVEGRWGAARS
jgi:O-antigen/teichoic acid export membrane protein